MIEVPSWEDHTALAEQIAARLIKLDDRVDALTARVAALETTPDPTPDPGPTPDPTPGLPSFADATVFLEPGDDWSTVPTGAIVGVRQGVYNLDRQRLNSATYIADPAGVKIDGGWDRTRSGTAIRYPFDSWNSQHGGTLDGFEIVGYLAASQQSAINGGLKHWTFRNLHIHHHRWGGIKLDTGSTFTDSLVAYCGQLNMKSEDDATDVTILNVATAFGNYWDWADWQWEGGGTKFPTRCARFTIRNMHAHDNHGAGIWFDGAHGGHVIEDSNAHDNQGPGIFYELSNGGARIANNQVTNNGGAAELYVSNARGLPDDPIVVTGNTIESGLTTRKYGWRAAAGFWHKEANPIETRSPRLGYVHTVGNTVRVADTGLGIVAGDFWASALDAPGMVWSKNRYEVTQAALDRKSGRVFQIGNRDSSWTAWQTAGRDTDGELIVI